MRMRSWGRVTRSAPMANRLIFHSILDRVRTVQKLQLTINWQEFLASHFDWSEFCCCCCDCWFSCENWKKCTSQFQDAQAKEVSTFRDRLSYSSFFFFRLENDAFSKIVVKLPMAQCKILMVTSFKYTLWTQLGLLFLSRSLADDTVVPPLVVMGGTPGQIVSYLNESFAFQREREARALYASFVNNWRIKWLNSNYNYNCITGL